MTNKADSNTAKAWWVSTGELNAGGEKIDGPFASRDDALNARVSIELRDSTDQYWVVEG